MQQYGFTSGNPRRAMYIGTVSTPSYGFTVFASAVVVDYVTTAGEKQHYHIDGTFGVVPRGEFKQLLVIHLAYQTHVRDVIFENKYNCNNTCYFRVCPSYTYL